MERLFPQILFVCLALSLFVACGNPATPNKGMIRILGDVATTQNDWRNPFSDQAKLRYFDSVTRNPRNSSDSINAAFFKANTMLEAGMEKETVTLLESLITKIPENDKLNRLVLKGRLGLAYLRWGERANCVNDHSAESCIFPISGRGVHADKTGSARAINLFESILSERPDDLETKWLLNIAYMTIGGYPNQVPDSFLIKGLDKGTENPVNPFTDVAMKTGLNINNMAGGSIIDDFNNDGYFDIITSSWGLDDGMHYCINNKDGSFTDMADESGLGSLGGGLNMMQTDYNNDGLKDIFVLRGGWKRNFGREPNSLLRNNGDGTFTDVTEEAGLMSFHPTQTATWNDFNNDGWLDVFVGNESTAEEENFCQLYINNKNGTFTEVTEKAGCRISAFVKGVTSGDYNNDGFADLFISTMDGRKFLFKNETRENNAAIKFRDATLESGIYINTTRTFPTWFWDFDNDGWLDILVSGYDYERSLAWYAAGEALGLPAGSEGKLILLRNKQDGTFEDLSGSMGLNKMVFAMGCNFGDIDNDGWLDIYLGTGNPQYQSLVPNKMFRNENGKRFADITHSARVGNLQKGHGVSFADLDNDGDQDIYIEMGGAFAGDVYQNSLYLNPGQNQNQWIGLNLEGTGCNRPAIGARIKINFIDNGILRSVYRDVSSGGSFGANPLTQHIGTGQARLVESVEIKWPGSTAIQIFRNVKTGVRYHIKQGDDRLNVIALKKTELGSASSRKSNPSEHEH